MKCENELPDTLHELLYVALCDLEEIEKDPRYSVEMGVWHTSSNPWGDDSISSSSQCFVCLAGSVLAKTCKLPITQDITPAELANLEIGMKLLAIDSLRTGSIYGAYRQLYEKHIPYADNLIFSTVAYGDPEWWDYMKDLLGYLQYLGI